MHADAGRVDVTFQGPVGFQDRIDALEAVLPEIVNARLSRVLVDYTHAWVSDSPVEAFEKLKARQRGENRLRGLKIALVNPPEFHALPTEDIAAERGFQVRRFNSRAAARAWLDRDAPTSG